jgi:hypothetical protein
MNKVRGILEDSKGSEGQLAGVSISSYHQDNLTPISQPKHPHTSIRLSQTFPFSPQNTSFFIYSSDKLI